MILVVQSLWNEAITDKLAEGALRVLQTEGHETRHVRVPGALEIPLAIKWAWSKGQRTQSHLLEGVVACGTIVKGETYHFDVVANESARALTDLSLDLRIPIGNALLAVYNIQDALERTGGKHGHKGEEAAHAVLDMLRLKREEG